ncbi:protein ZGRF1-like [Stegostoma tigrinum]|uniref:protein ZGRF1-like n=1 Tax=Stegostoma tigrinum TaxID=3053191 RepID=UPI00286FC8DF|nr:protein ZGRF1-like [Stegostoma tigrinum]
MSCREFVVLYTNQKTRKAKKWHDGILRTSSYGNKATLYDDKGLCLDHIYIKFEEIRSGNDFESDRYLITVEEEKPSQNEDANCSGQKMATKLVTTNIMPANLPRCHLPVGLKRKHTGFQGPREISKKPTIKENDTTSATNKSQAPNFSLPQVYATSPLFSTLCARETSSCSALVSEASSCTSSKDLSKEMMPSFSLLPPATLNHYEKPKHCEEMRSFRSAHTGFTYGDCNERISETLQSNTPTFPLGLSSHSELVRENKRSKAQILALLATKIESSSHDSETFEVKPQMPLVSNGTAFAAVDIAGHQQENCFDQHDYPYTNADPGLIQHCSTVSPAYHADRNITVNSSKSFGGDCSSCNTEEMNLNCEEMEDSIVQTTNDQTISPEVWATAAVDETLDNNICKSKEFSVKMDSPPRGLFSLADDEHSVQSVMPVESDMVDTNSFADINFNILGEFNLDEIGPNDLHGSEIEMLPQTSLSISSSSLKPTEVPLLLKVEETPEPKHLELEARLPVPEEENSDHISHEKCQTEIKPRAVTNAETLSETHTLVAHEISAVEIQENRINADEYSCLPAEGRTITLLKSLSEHSTAIESLEKLNVQNCFKDPAISKAKEQPFVSPKEASGEMIFKNVDLKHNYNVDHNPNYCRNINRALTIFATEHSLPALRNCLTENSCAPAKATGYGETFKGLMTNNSLKKMTASDRPLRALQNTSLSELCFPRADVSQGAKVLKREIIIPATFLSPTHYRQVFTAAITEHLNIWLFDLSQKLYKALSKVDISNYSSEKGGTAGKEQSFVPLCQHHQPAKLVMVKKKGPNKGRLFYTCDASKANQCKFFKWLDDIQTTNLEQEVEPQPKLMLSDAKSLGAFIRSQYISLYSECVLHIRKTPAFQRKKFYHGKVKEMINMEGDLESCCKTKLYLGLSRKENSSVYNKDDLWVVSKTLMFDPLDTFIACSVFYGPSSTSEVELLPLKGYSPSRWSSDMIVHALFVGNASTELSCLRNLQEHVNPASLPLLPHLLKMPCYDEAIVKSGRGRFISPALKMPVVMTGLLCKERPVALATEMMRKFHLNTDQAAALRQVAIMMAKGESPQDLILPVTVIHGVYGAGKSYLLAVLILFLVQLFEESEATEGPRQVPWKLLISASTNVAVDRVLLGLLELGFDRFIRVGSIRKIAKPILPYSLHAGSDNEELRELQALMKEDLTLVEKMHVRKSIEQHKLGRNRAVLKEVRVVGATCAACPFQCMNNLSFPLVLLDECSQITEPVSLLPIARFGCEKLILVGDPKQLPPTIQGSESAQEAGLEQTLFDRMCLMGHNPIMLRTQYRCHPTISAITNELFYNGNLKDGVSASNLNPLLDWLPTLCFYNVKGHDQLNRDGSCHNLEEATFTVKLIQSLIACGIKGSMIGVITLYKSQMHKLCGMLDYTAKCDPAEIKAVHISTVDAFQGAEKEVIILSCVRTRHVGFIDSEKRMNVALTRGKRHLLIVGNLTCLRNNRLWKRVIHHCEVRENGLKHAYQCEPELDQIIKCYNEQMVADKEQKNLKSRSKPILPEEGNKVVNTTEQAEGDKMSDVQDCTDY